MEPKEKREPNPAAGPRPTPEELEGLTAKQRRARREKWRRAAFPKSDEQIAHKAELDRIGRERKAEEEKARERNRRGARFVQRGALEHRRRGGDADRADADRASDPAQAAAQDPRPRRHAADQEATEV